MFFKSTFTPSFHSSCLLRVLPPLFPRVLLNHMVYVVHSLGLTSFNFLHTGAGVELSVEKEVSFHNPCDFNFFVSEITTVRSTTVTYQL